MIVLFCLGLLATGAPLDSRTAERAMELALQSELAGDPEGAKESVEALIRDANRSDEAVGRAMLQRWLAGAEVRARGLADGASIEHRVEAWDGFADAHLALRERAWRHLEAGTPGLSSRLESVRVEVDRSVGLRDTDLRAAVGRALQARQVSLRGTGLELAVRFEAEPPEKRGGFSRVRAELGVVLTSTGAGPPEPVALFSRSRAERRRAPEAALRFVLRRLSFDAAAAVRFALRRRALMAPSESPSRQETEPAPP